jgi:hypothetical protein
MVLATLQLSPALAPVGQMPVRVKFIFVWISCFIAGVAIDLVYRRMLSKFQKNKPCRFSQNLQIMILVKSLNCLEKSQTITSKQAYACEFTAQVSAHSKLWFRLK